MQAEAKRQAIATARSFWRGRGLLLCAMLILTAGLLRVCLPLEQVAVQQVLHRFPDAIASLQWARLAVLASLLCLPLVGVLWYVAAGCMDRWLAREFCKAFALSYGSIVVIYLLLDFSKNAKDFAEGMGLWQGAWLFYGTLAPSFLTLLLPFGLLMAVLLCVGKISRSRELVAALQSGRSLWRVMRPLWLAALWCSLFDGACYYHWAPRAEGERSALLEMAQGKAASVAKDVVFYSPEGKRVWKVGSFPRNFDQDVPLERVEVTSLREDGSMQSRLFAKQAHWRREDQCWIFNDAQVAEHRRNQAPEFIALPNPHVIRNWMETPAQILKPGLAAAHLGLPDLTSWLRSSVRGEWEQRLRLPYVTHWHYRLAHPFGCLLTALMAVPLAAYVTRRPNPANLIIAFCFSAFMLLLTNVFLALGESGNMAPWLAVWSPVVLYAIVGLWMMARRNAGRALW